MPLTLTISCSSKSRLVLTFLVLPFWYLLTWVVLDIFQKSSKTVVCVCGYRLLFNDTALMFIMLNVSVRDSHCTRFHRKIYHAGECKFGRCKCCQPAVCWSKLQSIIIRHIVIQSIEHKLLLEQACHLSHLSVCLSVSQSVSPVDECGKTADWIWMPFGVVSRACRGMGVLDRGGDHQRGRGSFGCECEASHCRQWGLCGIVVRNCIN